MNTDPNNITAQEGNVLIVRTCDKNMKAYSGFPWPEAGEVKAPEAWDTIWGPEPADWRGGFKPDANCGAGLHGLEEGEGDWGLMDWTCEAKALIVETDKANLVQL
jgi:hypothetical protein